MTQIVLWTCLGLFDSVRSEKLIPDGDLTWLGGARSWEAAAGFESAPEGALVDMRHGRTWSNRGI